MFVLRVFEIETGELYREFAHAGNDSVKCCRMTGDSTKVISVNCVHCVLFSKIDQKLKNTFCLEKVCILWSFSQI